MSDIGLLIAIPYWSGDAHRVTTLAKLLVGLQDEHAGNKAIVCPAHRSDCPANEEAEAILRSKFTVCRHASSYPWGGYPMGPNGLFCSIFSMTRYFYRNRVKAVLWMEPDAFPLRKNWIDALTAAWDRRAPHVYAMGNIFSVDGKKESRHLNGGAMYHPAFLDRVPEILETLKQAWDWERRAEILRVSADIPEIRYVHMARQMNVYPDASVAMLHGVKDDSLARMIAQKYKIAL